MPFLGPAPTFSSSHTYTSLGGHGLLGQEPAFLGPSCVETVELQQVQPGPRPKTSDGWRQRSPQGVPVDSWSLGVLLYILVYDHETLVKQISNGAYQQPPKPSSE
ncbi:hypothetical protein R6Z07F_011348 [Ovis aries]